MIPLECTKSSAYLKDGVNWLVGAPVTRSRFSAHLEQLKCIILDVKLAQCGIEQLPLHIFDVFHDETVVLRRRVLDDVPEGDDVGATREIAENLYFALDLLRGYGLEDFYDASLRVDHVDAFEDLCGEIERRGTLGG